MPAIPQLWRIYFVENCSHTTPIKDKFVVIVHVGRNPMGFFINSRIPEWLRQRPILLVCEARILAAEHSFLTHDSFVDCRQLYEFFDWELTKDKGKVSQQAREDILNAVRDCPVLERKYKDAILRHEGIL